MSTADVATSTNAGWCAQKHRPTRCCKAPRHAARATQRCCTARAPDAGYSAHAHRWSTWTRPSGCGRSGGKQSTQHCRSKLSRRAEGALRFRAPRAAGYRVQRPRGAEAGVGCLTTREQGRAARPSPRASLTHALSAACSCSLACDRCKAGCELPRRGHTGCGTRTRGKVHGGTAHAGATPPRNRRMRRWGAENAAEALLRSIRTSTAHQRGWPAAGQGQFQLP